MAIVNVTVTHSVAMSDATDAYVYSVLEAGLDLASDLLRVDARVHCEIRHMAAQVTDALSGKLIDSAVSVQALRAVQAPVSERDIDQSNGKVRIGDRKFRVARFELEFDPVLGDQLICDGIRYDIIALDRSVLGGVMMVYCRG